MSPLRWTLKSTRQLADALRERGHQISYRSVGPLLHAMGYSLQATTKMVEGAQHPDRNAQFEHINAEAKAFLAADDPVISIDCKKTLLVGGDPGYKNAGRQWRPVGTPRTAGVHDFPDPEVPKAIPYGVYDVGSDAGVGECRQRSRHRDLRRECRATVVERHGRSSYPKAKRLMVTTDAGGSNGYRSRLFKVELAKLTEETCLEITVCHFPPGTSKWNKIVLYTGFPGVYEGLR